MTLRENAALVPPPTLEDELADLIGNFDTGIRCQGRECSANVIDHASERRPIADALQELAHIRIEPVRFKHKEFRGYGIRHVYFCNSCGITYRNEVIEGPLGYVPRERRQT